MSRKHPGAPPSFVLWREVLAAYAMPAASAGIAGALTRQPELVTAAFTTIGGTSALVAALVGAVLRRRRARAEAGRAARALGALGRALVAAAVALAVGLAAARWLPFPGALADGPWPGRLPIDLPVSSALATFIVTWRWSGSRHRPTADPAARPAAG